MRNTVCHRRATPPYGPPFLRTVVSAVLRTVVPAARGWAPEPVRAPAPARAGRAPGPAEWARAPAASERAGSAPEAWGPAGRAPGPAEPDRVRVSARAWAPAVSARGPASAPAAQGRDTAASCCPPAIGTSALDYSPAYPRPDRAVTRSPARNRGNPPGRPVGVRRRIPWSRVAQNRSGWAVTHSSAARTSASSAAGASSGWRPAHFTTYGHSGATGRPSRPAIA